MRTALVINHHARHGAHGQQVHEALRDSGIDARPQTVDGPDLVRTLRQASRRADTVIVAGGDGTITAAVQELAHQRAALAIIPLGTQNNFARSLHIPTDIGQACKVIAAGHVEPVDVGRAGDTYFANAVTIGLTGQIARDTPRGLKRAVGQVAYALVGAKSLVTAKPFQCTLHAGDEEWHLTTHQLVIANGRVVGDGLAAPGASSRDGMLDVSSLGDGTRRGLLGAWRDFQRGRHTQRDDSFHARVPEIRIETEPPRRIDIDGELAGMLPATFSVEAKALRVVVPGDSSALAGNRVL